MLKHSKAIVLIERQGGGATGNHNETIINHNGASVAHEINSETYDFDLLGYFLARLRAYN